MNAFARAAEFFVAPAADRPAARPAAVASVHSIAVLGPLRDSLPVAATLGTLIAVWEPRPRPPHVMAAEPPQRAEGQLATPAAADPPRRAEGPPAAADPPPRAEGPPAAAESPPRAEGPLATPAAARLARWASGRGHDAVARGRTVRVALGAEPRHACAEATRLAGAAGAPVVTVLAGPRDGALDAFLAEQDRVLLVVRPDTDPDLVMLTLSGLGPNAVTVPALTGPARLLAAAGWLRRDLGACGVPA